MLYFFCYKILIVKEVIAPMDKSLNNFDSGDFLLKLDSILSVGNQLYTGQYLYL